MIKLNVIEDQRKVVAKLDGCENDAFNILCKRLPSFINIDKEAVKIKSVFKACAVCHPDDEFDVEAGIKIAKARVVEKYNRAMYKVLSNVANSVDAYIEYVDIKLEHFED